MAYINLEKFNIRKETSRIFGLPRFINPISHILNGPINKHYLSYDVAVIQWITSCHINHMTKRVITHWRVHATSLTMSASTRHFRIEIMFIWKATKSHFKGSYDKQNLIVVVMLYEIYETRRKLVS